MSTALSTVGPAAGFGLLLTPETIAGAKELAQTLADSGLVPTAYVGKPNAILIAGAMGHALGLGIFASLANIAVIQGKPCLYGDGLLAVCQNHPQWEDISETVVGVGDATVAHVVVKRKGREPYSTSFGFADARAANLWGKSGPWSQQPKRMCMMRARAFALRGAFADALAGFHAREEMDDAEGARDVTAGMTVHDDPPAGRARELPPEVPAAAIPPSTQAAPAAVDPVPAQQASGTASSEVPKQTDPPAGKATDTQGKEVPPITLKDVLDLTGEIHKKWTKRASTKFREVLDRPTVRLDLMAKAKPEQVPELHLALLEIRRDLTAEDDAAAAKVANARKPE